MIKNIVTTGIACAYIGSSKVNVYSIQKSSKIPQSYSEDTYRTQYLKKITDSKKKKVEGSLASLAKTA